MSGVRNGPCAACGHPADEHSYNGACYGLCGEWVPPKPATTLAEQLAAARAEGIAEGVEPTARPLDEWHEDIGDVLWWFFPMTEAPWVGRPTDLGRRMRIRICCGREDNEIELQHEEPGGGWPGYHTHWTPLPPVPSPRGKG